MDKRASSCATLIASLLAILFVLIAPLTLLAFNTGRVVFNPPLVKRLVADEVVRSDLIPVALEWFSERRAHERVERGEALTGVNEPDVALLMSYLTGDDWRRIKAEVLPDEMLEGWVSVTVDGVYAWIDSPDPVPQIAFSLAPFKDRVGGPHGVNAIMVAYNRLKPCTQAEIADFKKRQAAAPPGTEVLYNLCQFPDPWREDQVGDYMRAVGDLVRQVPDRFALTEELSRAGASSGHGVGAAVIKLGLRLSRALMRWGWLVPAVLLLLILIIRVRSVADLGGWWGIPILLAGVIALLVATSYRLGVTRLLVAGPLSEAPALVVHEATRASLRLTERIFRPMQVQALALIVVGLVLSLLLAFRQRKAPQAHQAAA